MKLITFCVETLLTTPRDKAKECNFYSLGLSFLSARLAAGMDRWVRNSEFSLHCTVCLPTADFLQRWLNFSIPQLTQPLNQHTSPQFTYKRLLFFFFATLCSFYGSLVPGIKSGSSAVRALSPNPWISREFPVYLQRALGELRGKKKTNVLMVNTKHLGSGYQKKSRKGRLEAEYQLFFFFSFERKYSCEKTQYLPYDNMYVHMQGVYINSCWRRK